jgi:threonine/homoserine/homoserine lactone efflux protein
MLTDLLPLMVYCFVMSSTPGPNNVMLATSGANFGFRRALPQIWGQLTGTALLTYVTCLGLGRVFEVYPVLHQLLHGAGALYLLYLAWKLSGAGLAEAQVSQPLSFAQAALFQALNPKSWVKAITLATVFMPVAWSVPAGALLVAVLGMLIGFPSASMWALFGVLIRGLLVDPFKRRIFNLSMGATLLVLAVSLLR